MTDDEPTIDIMEIDMDDWEVFKSHHMRLIRCDCGCGTLQMLGCDEDDEVRAVIAHLPQQWIDICRAITNESIAMMKGEPGLVGYPPKDDDSGHTH